MAAGGSVEVQEFIGVQQELAGVREAVLALVGGEGGAFLGPRRALEHEAEVGGCGSSWCRRAAILGVGK